MKKFNITYDNGTSLLRSIIIIARTVSEAITKFGSDDVIVGLVEVNPQPRSKPITILADLTAGTLLTNGRKEKILTVDHDSITTETAVYKKETVKCIN